MKNNKLINSMLQIARRNRADNIYAAEQNITPHVYAAIALVLYERGWRHKRINDLFVETEHLWTEYSLRGEEMTMVQLCEEKTGILLLNPEQAKEQNE